MTNDAINEYQARICQILGEINDMQKSVTIPQQIRNQLSGAKSLLNKSRRLLEEERPMEGQMSIEDVFSEMEL